MYVGHPYSYLGHISLAQQNTAHITGLWGRPNPSGQAISIQHRVDGQNWD